MRRTHDGGPVWVRVVRDPALLLLDVDDVRRALEGSPRPVRVRPRAKRKGMAHFQPDALTISRGELWRKRRAFTEAVLDTAPPAPLAERFVAVAREEVARARRRGRASSTGSPGAGVPADHAAGRARRRRRRRRRALPRLLGELMDEANGMPGERSERYSSRSSRRLGAYVDGGRGRAASSALFARRPPTRDTTPSGPAAALAVRDSATRSRSTPCARWRCSRAHPSERSASGARADESGAYLDACLQEAMRLWPTTPLLSRETVADATDWGGEAVPAGTQVLIVEHLPATATATGTSSPTASRPRPGSTATPRDDWAFNHFSHGPQGCPGAEPRAARRQGGARERCCERGVGARLAGARPGEARCRTCSTSSRSAFGWAGDERRGVGGRRAAGCPGAAQAALPRPARRGAGDARRPRAPSTRGSPAR